MLGGSTIPLNLVSATKLGNAVEAKYSFTPPDQFVTDTWDPTDNGSYTIDLLPGEVKDLDTVPKEVPAQTLGTFTKSEIQIDSLQNLMAGGKELQTLSHELGGTV